MTNKNTLNLIKSAPNGFSVDETDTWLKSFLAITDFSDIQSLLNKNLTNNDYQAITILLAQKYIGIDFQQKFTKENCLDYKTKSLRLYQDKSKTLDLFVTKEINKIILSHSRNVEIIALPQMKNIEALYIFGFSRLRIFNNISELTNLKYLTISLCNKFKDFSFISKMKNLIYLNLGNNKNLEHILFLEKNKSIIFLILHSTKVIKHSSTIDVLKSLPNLKYLIIAANQSERKKIAKTFPKLFEYEKQMLNK